MTPLPKRRHSTHRGGKREAAIRKTLPVGQKCPKCTAAKLPHHVCPNCGYYHEKQLVAPKTKKKQPRS